MKVEAAGASSVAGAAIAVTLLVACGDGTIGSRPAPEPFDGAAPDDARASQASGPDAASITPRPDLCQGLTLGTAPVDELELAGDPPVPLGGELLAGTYDLTELDVYAGPSAPEDMDAGGHGPSFPRLTGQSANATLIVSEFAIRTVEVRGPSGSAPPPERARAALYRIDGTSLGATAVCPATALPSAIPFSVVGEGLAIFSDARHRELYLRR